MSKSDQHCKVMVVASHPDDAEIGMGGTIAALTSADISTVVVDLTNGEPTPYGSPEKRRLESGTASEVLGLKHRETLSLKNREIFDTLENRKLLAATIRKYKPEILFLPYWEDGHPDHINASTLGVASRFFAKLSNIDIAGEPHYPRKMLHYFCTHIRPKFTPAFVFDISTYIDRKLASVAAYKSQFSENPKNSGVLDMIKAEAAYWGSQVGIAYGEAFVSRENIRLSDPKTILDL